MQEAQQSEGLDLLKETPGRRRAISADSGASIQSSKTKDPENIRRSV